MKLRQSPRLKGFSYRGGFAYNLTFVTRGRKPLLAQPAVVHPCLDDLTVAAVQDGFDLLAYCFMPDHLHVLACGSQNASLQEFARHFKQLSGYHFKEKHGAHLWQISYYDHVVRREESLKTIAAYIWDNPVRKGLVRNRQDFAFSGPREFLDES